MPKPKRTRVQQAQDVQVHARTNTSHGAGKKHRKMSSFAKLSTKSNNYNDDGSNAQQHGRGEKGAQSQKKQPQKQQKQQQNRRPIVPFRRRDRVLCVGEGDFSFARSLATHHRCKNLLATCYDSQETLYEKYPQAEKNVAEIIAAQSSSYKPQGEKGQQQNPSPKVLFSVDAKKLGASSGGGKDVRLGFPNKGKKRPAWKKDDLNKSRTRSAGGPWDMICFNFPHVGGLSTDVNRQVRANQELLVAFFKSCVPLLAAKPDDDGEDEMDDEEDSWGIGTEESDRDDKDEIRSDKENSDDDFARAKDERRMEPGQILVTLFEGEPYTVFEVKTDDDTPSLRRAAGKRKKRPVESDDFSRHVPVPRPKVQL